MIVRSVSIEVRDLDRAARFWEGALGIEFREVVTRQRDGLFATLPGGVTLKLILADDLDGTTRSHHTLGIGVSDVEGVVELVEELGGRRIGKILRNGDLAHARVRDADGNEFELYTG